MKLLEHAPESGWNDNDTIEYKLDREIIKIENVSRRHYNDGFMYAEVTFEPAENEDFIMTRILMTRIQSSFSAGSKVTIGRQDNEKENHTNICIWKSVIYISRS